MGGGNAQKVCDSSPCDAMLVSAGQRRWNNAGRILALLSAVSARTF